MAGALTAVAILVVRTRVQPTVLVTGLGNRRPGPRSVVVSVVAVGVVLVGVGQRFVGVQVPGPGRRGTGAGSWSWGRVSGTGSLRFGV